MSRSSIACAAALAAFSIAVLPPAQAANVTLRGASTCSVWTKERAQNRADYEKAWLSGYFSGLAMGTDINFWGAPGKTDIDNEAVWKWMDAYCAANPQSSLVIAAEKLFIERVRIVVE